MSQFFEILIFNGDIWGNVHYGREINLISEETNKSLLSPEQNKLKEIRETVFKRFPDYTLHGFVPQS